MWYCKICCKHSIGPPNHSALKYSQHFPLEWRFPLHISPHVVLFLLRTQTFITHTSFLTLFAILQFLFLSNNISEDLLYAESCSLCCALGATNFIPPKHLEKSSIITPFYQLVMKWLAREWQPCELDLLGLASCPVLCPNQHAVQPLQFERRGTHPYSPQIPWANPLTPRASLMALWKRKHLHK